MIGPRKLFHLWISRTEAYFLRVIIRHGEKAKSGTRIPSDIRTFFYGVVGFVAMCIAFWLTLRFFK